MKHRTVDNVVFPTGVDSRDDLRRPIASTSTTVWRTTASEWPRLDVPAILP